MSWYAIYTKSRAEKKLAVKLTELGIENYLPIRKELRQWSDRKKWVEVPAISCYLFVNIDEVGKTLLFKQDHFVAFVRSFGKPAIIPDVQIEAMKRALEANVEHTFEPTPLLVGQKVRVTTTPLEGIEGVITKSTGKNKLYISIETTGLSLVIDLEKFDFELL